MTDDPLNIDNDLIWGARAIGREIGRNTRQTYWLLETGKLDDVARKVCDRWVASRGKLRSKVMPKTA